MKKSLLIKLHLYCGLFTIFYLVAFGISAIILNHGINVDKQEVTTSWQQRIGVDQQLSDEELAESAKNQLGLMGWNPYWEFKRTNGQFSFLVTHPGRVYRVKLQMKDGQAEIDEIPKGFIAVLQNLHFFNGNVPNAPFLLRSWAFYQWLTLLSMIFSLILGLWLWIRYSYRTWEGVVFGGLMMITVIIMMLI